MKLIVDDFVRLTKDLIDHNILEFQIVIVGVVVVDVQGYPKPLV